MNRFEGVAIAFSAEGLPLLERPAAHLCCRVAGVHKAGDTISFRARCSRAKRRLAVRWSFTRAFTAVFNGHDPQLQRVGGYFLVDFGGRFSVKARRPSS
jgi:flavin reductase (DIM6/NTAB) family NADH-FMN oxidoreductase RutF